MSWVSVVCFGICSGIILTTLNRGADPLSPTRIFAFMWSIAIALTELKYSAFQHEWNAQSWILLLIPIGSFLLGTFVAYVVNLEKDLVPIHKMRVRLNAERVREKQLFWLICLVTTVYAISYLANFLIKGWLPIEAAEKHVSRVDFNVTGLSFLTYLVPSIMFFVVLYFLKVQAKKGKKVVLAILFLVVLGSFLLFVSRFQIIMIIIICVTLFYYSTQYIRFRTGLTLFLFVTGFFYWISSIRLSHLVATYLHTASRMRFSKDYALFTEPYMYFVMNLENFGRSVNLLESHTYGYYTFDFITAMSGLKYWVYDYFRMERHPFLISSYNTYTSFWPFYSDFGVVGLALIPLVLGLGIGMLYYQMRIRPSTKNVTAYGVMVFVMFLSFFIFPLSWLWFELNMLVIYLGLRWTMIPWKEHVLSSSL
ncbi:MAG TPA: O-antigen polymerase [Bacteroidota bacterium]